MNFRVGYSNSRWLKPSVALLPFLLGSPITYALNLGDAVVQSAVMQPLDMVVELTDLGDVNPSLVEFRQATPQEYQQFYLESDAAQYSLKPVRVTSRNGRTYLQLVSNQSVSSKDVTMVLVAQWPGGKRFKAYTFQLGDPVATATIRPQPKPVVSQRKGETLAPVTNGQVANPTDNKVQATGANRTNSQNRTSSGQSGAQRSNTSGGAVIRYANAQAVEVDKGSTLWSIAGSMPGEGTRFQKMMALYQANPNAFIDGNINLIKSGAKLVIPSASQITQLTPTLAINEFDELIKRYSNQSTIAASSSRVANTNTSQQGQITRSDSSKDNRSKLDKPKPEQQKVLTITNPDSTSGETASDALGNSAEGASDQLNALRDRLGQTEEALASAEGANKRNQQTVQTLEDTLTEREGLFNLPKDPLATAGSDKDLTASSSPFERSADSAENGLNTGSKNEADISAIEVVPEDSQYFESDNIDVRDSLDQSFAGDDSTPFGESQDGVDNKGAAATNDFDDEASAPYNKRSWLLFLSALFIGGIWWLMRRRKKNADSDFDDFEFRPILKTNLDGQESEALIAQTNVALDGSRNRQAGDLIEELIDRKTPHIMATIELVSRLADVGSYKRARLLVNKLNNLELTTKEEAALEDLQDQLASINELDFDDLDALASEDSNAVPTSNFTDSSATQNSNTIAHPVDGFDSHNSIQEEPNVHSDPDGGYLIGDNPDVDMDSHTVSEVVDSREHDTPSAVDQAQTTDELDIVDVDAPTTLDLEEALEHQDEHQSINPTAAATGVVAATAASIAAAVSGLASGEATAEQNNLKKPNDAIDELSQYLPVIENDIDDDDINSAEGMLDSAANPTVTSAEEVLDVGDLSEDLSEEALEKVEHELSDVSEVEEIEQFVNADPQTEEVEKIGDAGGDEPSDAVATVDDNQADLAGPNEDVGLGSNENEYPLDVDKPTEPNDSVVEEGTSSNEATSPKEADGDASSSDFADNTDNTDNNKNTDDPEAAIIEGLNDDIGVYSSRLDLAKAYFEMGDSETAAVLLRPVIDNGTENQVADAKQLLDKYQIKITT